MCLILVTDCVQANVVDIMFFIGYVYVKINKHCLIKTASAISKHKHPFVHKSYIMMKFGILFLPRSL